MSNHPASNDPKADKIIVCISGRCSSWGKHWKKHLYDGGETCLRCGMDREEQFNEDKSMHLVTGAYIPNTRKPHVSKISTSQKLMYCALGDYGIENAFDTEKKCQKWIDDQNEEYKHGDDYYQIVTHTKAELARMPEV